MKNTVALQGIRFWKVEDGYMLTTKVACVTAFRNYIGVRPYPDSPTLIQRLIQRVIFRCLQPGLKMKTDRWFLKGML